MLRPYVIAENERPLNGIKLLRGRFPDFDTKSIDGRMRMIRTHRHKLVWSDMRPSEFYDLESDPGELHDVSGTLSEARASLQAELEEWMRRNEGKAGADRFESDDAASLERLRALGYIE